MAHINQLFQALFIEHCSNNKPEPKPSIKNTHTLTLTQMHSNNETEREKESEEKNWATTIWKDKFCNEKLVNKQG